MHCCYALFCTGFGVCQCCSDRKVRKQGDVFFFFLKKNLAVSYTLDNKTTYKPYFMFVLNIPMWGSSMTVYSQADLSQPLSSQLARQRQYTQPTLNRADALGSRQSIQSIQISSLYIELEQLDTHPSNSYTSQLLI